MDLTPKQTPAARRISSWVAHTLQLDREEAGEIAEAVRETFGPETVITDWDVPDKPTRALLYRLYRNGLVETHTIEKPRPEDGRLWRYHHWVLQIPKGWPEGQDPAQNDASQEGASDPYSALPSDIWDREGAAQA